MEKFASIDAFKLMQAPDPTESLIAASRIEANARLRFSVAQALVQGRMGFHFQPVVRAANPRVPAFFEMLARMTLPDGQILAAGAFLPSVEAGPLGRAIDRLALAHALRALAANPSAAALGQHVDRCRWATRSGCRSSPRAARDGSGLLGRLILEITEDAAMRDIAQTIDFMDHVRATGCAFALDDFGAGATGFKYFRDFRFDMVKIDGAFVRGVHVQRDAQVLVECLGAVARHFEMATVAEFVETEAEAAWLREHGIDCLQGYLYGKPSPVAELPRADAAAGRRVG